MKCDDVQRMISDMQDGALSDRAERRVRRHVQSCDACRDFARRLGELQQRLDSLPAVPDDPRRGEEYWAGLPGRIRERLGEGAGYAATARPSLRFRLAGAALVVLLMAAIGGAAYEHGRTRALREHLSDLHARASGPGLRGSVPSGGGAPPTTLAGCGIGARQRRLFHEMSLAFADDLRWVATDGDRIDFGLSRGPAGVAVAALEGPVVGVGLSVTRATPGREAEAPGAMSIVAFEGSSAEFVSQQAGVLVRFACTPRTLADGRVGVDIRVGLSNPSTGAQGALHTEATLVPGSQAEVGRMVLDGETFVLRACADVWESDEGPSVEAAPL